MCAATLSASRPGCSMPASAVSTSGGTLRLSFTYCSNCEVTERASTSISRSSYCSTSLNGDTSAEKYWPVCSFSILARSAPSTSTLTVPSGSFSSCRIVATVPSRYRSCAPGSSTSACFCATSRICLPARIAWSSARIDFSRPTNSGMTMCGYTTTSRSGSTGSAAGTRAFGFGSVDRCSREVPMVNRRRRADRDERCEKSAAKIPEAALPLPAAKARSLLRLSPICDEREFRVEPLDCAQRRRAPRGRPASS